LSPDVESLSPKVQISKPYGDINTATQFTTLNDSGYGCYDMFSDAAPYGPKAQFNAMVSEVQKYGGIPG
jgi:hypothetical protein